MNDDTSAIPSCSSGSLPEISRQNWYVDPRDPRCPHDAWLGRFEFDIVGREPDESRCPRVIRIKLLGAYHNGTITFTYRGVRAYSVALSDPQGADRMPRRRDWLNDAVEVLEGGFIRHQIEWESQNWVIESLQAEYEWSPN
jgi:hypothetical protein